MENPLNFDDLLQAIRASAVFGEQLRWNAARNPAAAVHAAIVRNPGLSRREAREVVGSIKRVRNPEPLMTKELRLRRENDNLRDDIWSAYEELIGGDIDGAMDCLAPHLPEREDPKTFWIDRNES